MMIVFIPPASHRPGPRGTGRPPQSAVVVAIVAACLGVFFVAATLGRPGAPRLGMGEWAAIAAAVVILGAAIVALVAARSRSLGDEPPTAAEPSADTAHATHTGDTAHATDSDAQRPIALLVVSAVTAVLGAVILVLWLFSSRANAQEWRPATGVARPVAAQSEAVAYLLLRGNDTVMVERATITRELLSGEISARGAPRVAWVGEVRPGPAVPVLTFRVYGPGAPPDGPALQAGTLTIRTDSAVIEVAATGGAPQRVAVAITGTPLPLLNGSMTLTNLMIARARASSVRPYRDKVHFLQGAGVPLDVTIDSIGGDSALFSINSQLHRFALDADGRIAGGSIPSQGVSIARVSGAAATRISLGRPDYGAPAGAPYAAEEVTVPTPAGHVLTGTLTVPKGAAGRVPAVVTITGSGQQDRDEYLPLVPNYRPFRQLADTLGRRGIAVLRLDDRGVNGSGGNVASATSADFADDIRAGVAFLRARADIDAARIGLLGHSEGGAIGPMVAANDRTIAAVVLLAGPAYNGRRIIDFQLRNLVMGDSSIPAAKKDSVAREARAAFDSTTGRTAWMRFFLDYDPLAALARVHAPVLILQGGTDQQVTPEQAPIIERALKAAGNRDVTMRVFANRNHLFLNDPVGFPRDYPKIKDGRIGPDVMGPLADWLALKLSAARPQP
jgi:hypothetical protein